MNLFIIFLSFSLIQLLTLVSTNPLPVDTSEKNLLEFFDNELHTIAKDFCEKAKNISENLLKNEDFHKSSQAEEIELKRSLQAFLKDYPYIERFDLYEPILATFIYLMKPEFNNINNNQSQENQEIDTKFQELLKQNFANLLKDYEGNYQKFIKEKLLQKLEDYKMNLSSAKSKHVEDFNKIIVNLKTCTNYQCLPTDHDFLLVVLDNAKDLYIKYLGLDIKKGVTLSYMKLNEIFKNLLQDKEKLGQLNADCRQNLTNFMNAFVTQFESSGDIEKFISSNKDIINISGNKEINTEFCSKDREFFKENFSFEKTDESKYVLARDNVIKELNSKMVVFAIISAIDKLFEHFG